jgi:hypothetical protein
MAPRGNVRALYLSVLARPADDGGLDYYAGEWKRLVSSYIQDSSGKPGRSGQDYAAIRIREAMANSAEGQNRAGVIRNAYQTYLGRQPSNQELQNYVNQSRNTLSLVKEISESQESFTFKKNLRDSYLRSYDDLMQFARNNNENESAGRSVTGFVGNQEDLAALDHWTKYGRNERRMIPAQGILIFKNGRIEYSQGAQKLLSNYVKQKYDNLISGFNNSNGGNYKDLMNQVNNLGDNVVKQNFFNAGSKDSVDGFYIKNKLKVWDGSKYGAQPPVGGFDAEYYRGIDSSVQNDWNAAKNNRVAGYSVPDLDITLRYNNIDTFAQLKYTNAVRNNPNVRGNPVVKSESEDYTETLTDADRQRIRDNILGLTDKTDSGNLTINWENDAGVIEADSLLESQVGASFDKKELEQQGRFQALATDALRTAANELRKQRAKEAELSIYKGLPGFNEIYSANASLANSILGDSGLGGMLALSGQDTDAIGESLEKQLEGITGISNNSSIYNWQKWFDESLTKRYEEMDEIKGFTDADKDKIYQIEQEFKDKFINEYLKPRFDESKSMSEFISYIDTVDKESEQNIFQTQTALNSLRDFANLRAREYYTQNLQDADSVGFDSNFYFDPFGTASNANKVKDNEEIYLKQKDDVGKSWENAKKNPNGRPPDSQYTWKQWAYYYGYDLNNKDDFARLHYAVVGKGKGFDPAENVVTDQEVKDYINTSLLPALADEKLDIGDTSFLAFVTPAEFAESVLEGIDPLENKEEWKKVLEAYGFEDDATLEEVKKYIEDAVRTGQAKDIRESLKYLNEKKKKPTQERLGVDYIEREEDDKDLASDEETAFFKIFKDAGYGGTQEEFFDQFMPDVDRGELISLGKAATGDFRLKDTVSDDPFDGSGSSTSEDKNDSYFSLFDDKEDDSDYATDTGRSIINEYASFFK